MNRRLQFWLGLAGVAVAAGLVASQGAADVFRSLLTVRWSIVPVCAAFLMFLGLGTAGWRTLFPAAQRLRFRTLLWARWISNSINNLLPVAQIGGDLIRIRMLMQRGMPGPAAAASVVVDVTLAVVTQIAFAVIGIGLWLWTAGWSRSATAALAVMGVFALGAGSFFLLQHAGLFGRAAGAMRRVVKTEQWGAVTGGAEALDRAVVSTYRRRRAVVRATGWRMLSWFAAALEVWIILRALGQPVSVIEAVIVESLGQAVRKAAFLVPGAVGVQEGGFMILGASLGLAAEVGLTLSLVKRLRELLVGLPALAAWQWARQATNRKTAIPEGTSG